MLLNLMISYFSHFFSFHVIFIYLLLFFLFVDILVGYPMVPLPVLTKDTRCCVFFVFRVLASWLFAVEVFLLAFDAWDLFYV